MARQAISTNKHTHKTYTHTNLALIICCQVNLHCSLSRYRANSSETYSTIFQYAYRQTHNAHLYIIGQDISWFGFWFSLFTSRTRWVKPNIFIHSIKHICNPHPIAAWPDTTAIFSERARAASSSSIIMFAVTLIDDHGGWEKKKIIRTKHTPAPDLVYILYGWHNRPHSAPSAAPPSTQNQLPSPYIHIPQHLRSAICWASNLLRPLETRTRADMKAVDAVNDVCFWA